MKNLLLVLTIITAVGCGKLHSVLEKAESIPGKMDSLNQGMTKTNESVRLQKLSEADHKLMDEANYDVLAPVPVFLLSAGKIFGEELTSEEALLWVYKNMVYLNKHFIVDNPSFDSQNPEHVAKFDKKKMGVFSALMVVSGNLKDSVVDEIILHIHKSGRYSKTGYEILALRQFFFDQLMIQASVFSESPDKLEKLGHIEKAIEFNSKIERIARLSQPQLIKVSLTGMANQDLNTEITFDPAVVHTNWVEIKKRAEAGFQTHTLTTDVKEDPSQIAAQKATFAKLMSFLDGKIQQKLQ